MNQDVIDAANTVDHTSDKLYMSSEFNIQALVEMAFSIGFVDTVIVGAPEMIALLQSTVILASKDFTSCPSTEFLGIPLIADEDIPWGNRIIFYDKNDLSAMAAYVVTAYDGEAPFSEAKAARAEEALRQLGLTMEKYPSGQKVMDSD